MAAYNRSILVAAVAACILLCGAGLAAGMTQNENASQAKDDAADSTGRKGDRRNRSKEKPAADAASADQTRPGRATHRR